VTQYVTQDYMYVLVGMKLHISKRLLSILFYSQPRTRQWTIKAT